MPGLVERTREQILDFSRETWISSTVENYSARLCPTIWPRTTTRRSFFPRFNIELRIRALSGPQQFPHISQPPTMAPHLSKPPKPPPPPLPQRLLEKLIEKLLVLPTIPEDIDGSTIPRAPASSTPSAPPPHPDPTLPPLWTENPNSLSRADRAAQSAKTQTAFKEQMYPVAKKTEDDSLWSILKDMVWLLGDVVLFIRDATMILVKDLASVGVFLVGAAMQRVLDLMDVLCGVRRKLRRWAFTKVGRKSWIWWMFCAACRSETEEMGVYQGRRVLDLMDLLCGVQVGN